MSIQFEIEAGDPRDVVLGVDAYTNRAIVDMQDNRGYGAGATFTADQLRRLRRFLEYCYPASEDPPHEPDPWLAATPEPGSLLMWPGCYRVIPEAPGGER